MYDYIYIKLAAGVSIPWDITIKMEGYLPGSPSILYQENTYPIVTQYGNGDYWIEEKGFGSSESIVNLTFQHIKLVLMPGFTGYWYVFFY
jgi:hypothetical protein